MLSRVPDPTGRRTERTRSFTVKKETITEEEKKSRLRGCYECDLKKDFTIMKDSTLSLQPRVTTLVTCKALDGRAVTPTKESDPKKCPRLLHVERKKFNPKHIAHRTGSKK